MTLSQHPFVCPTLLKHFTLCVGVCVCEHDTFLCPTGLNGRPVCMVRDDWNVTSSLFPHPLLKGHALRKTAHPSFAFPSAQNLYGVNSNKSKGVFALTVAPFSHYFSKALDKGSNFPKYFTALFSEAWRDELRTRCKSQFVFSSATGQKRGTRIAVI